ncbi:hypothetical protein PIB30_114108, partial [Stylosanthes scabra]|nr:hypothetical protein [Stylosanthes scabra]
WEGACGILVPIMSSSHGTWLSNSCRAQRIWLTLDGPWVLLVYLLRPCTQGTTSSCRMMPQHLAVDSR